jgi:iron complex outermembrane recepter protein
MSSRKILTGVALMALWAGVSAGAAHAQTATDAPIATDTMGGDIIVFGAGQVRQTATVNDQIISIATPGTSGLKAIERLPGVSFQSADPLGNYEWSARISIRASRWMACPWAT